MREIFASRAFVYILIASSVVAFLGYGKALWTISFFIRSHGLSTTEAGLSMAVVLGLAGVFGTWLGGKVADRFGPRDKKHILTLPAYGMALAAPVLFLRSEEHPSALQSLMRQSYAVFCFKQKTHPMNGNSKS